MRWLKSYLPKEKRMGSAPPEDEQIDMRRRALSRWDDEGGSIAASSPTPETPVPDLTNAELVQLRIRVIALENLVIGFLAEGTDHQLDVERRMASYITPREGQKKHPLTVQAAQHMVDLVNRAIHFRTVPLP